MKQRIRLSRRTFLAMAAVVPCWFAPQANAARGSAPRGLEAHWLAVRNVIETGIIGKIVWSHCTYEPGTWEATLRAMEFALMLSNPAGVRHSPGLESIPDSDVFNIVYPGGEAILLSPIPRPDAVYPAVVRGIRATLHIYTDRLLLQSDSKFQREFQVRFGQPNRIELPL